MKSSLKTTDYHRCSHDEGRDEAMVDGVQGGGRIRANNVLVPAPILPAREGPFVKLPADVLCIIATHLWISETMSLRCTGHATQGHLKVVTDAILEGCRVIEHATRREAPLDSSFLEVIDKLSTVSVAIRCDMLQRYARMAAFARRVQPSGVEDGQRVFALREHYHWKPSSDPDSQDARLAQSWKITVEKAKADLCAVAHDVSRTEAMSSLYAAEMYAPMLGVISDPSDHVERVMSEAAETLAPLQWVSYLYLLAPLLSISKPIQTAQKALLDTVDARYATLRPMVLAEMVRWAMLFGRPTSVQEWCVSRIGITPRRLALELIPRVAYSFVKLYVKAFADPLVYTRTRENMRLQLLRWGGDDMPFAASLHRSFLAVLAARHCSVALPWSIQSKAARIALATKVVGITPGVCEQFKITCKQVVGFWSAYFYLDAPSSKTLAPEMGSEIDALPWPLQSALWWLVANRHADPDGAFGGAITPVFHALSVQRVDLLCAEALKDGQPALAIPALEAALRWEVTRACSARWESAPRSAFSRVFSPVGRPVNYLVCTSLASAVIDQCTVGQRLPFVAALFSYRDLLLKSGYEWTFEAMISKDVGSYLCDPTALLIRPSEAIVNVLLHYLPLFRERLPEFALGPLAWEAAFVKRFDLPAADMKRQVTWGQAFLSSPRHDLV